MNLNLGCGNDKRGSIRIDINPDKEGVNLVADAHYLPIRKKVVNVTLCKSVLEHVESPIKAMLEMKRVTRNEIIIVVPNILNIRRIMRGLLFPLHKVSPRTFHLQIWDAKLMKHLAIMSGLNFISLEWEFEKPNSLGFICKPLLSSHMKTTLKDKVELCESCGSEKKHIWCDPEFTYCPECDIEGDEKTCLKL